MRTTSNWIRDDGYKGGRRRDSHHDAPCCVDDGGDVARPERSCSAQGDQVSATVVLFNEMAPNDAKALFFNVESENTAPPRGQSPRALSKALLTSELGPIGKGETRTRRDVSNIPEPHDDKLSVFPNGALKQRRPEGEHPGPKVIRGNMGDMPCALSCHERRPHNERHVFHSKDALAPSIEYEMIRVIN